MQRIWNNAAYDHAMQKLHDAGFVAYAVGGCVRDSLVGAEPKDMDIATNARPHDLPKVFGTKPWDGEGAIRIAEGNVALYPTGVSHGTWTVRVGSDIAEITTFRNDVSTDGRRATVEFADSMEEDAMRRDFTMNALYMDYSGNIHDPSGSGISDLRGGKVRFVGTADGRIQEDFLRILRLFRFHGRFGRGPMNTEAWEAAEKYRMKIAEHVSKERVWDELKKILGLYSPAEALWEMQATGVLHAVLGVNIPSTLGDVFAAERKYRIDPDWVHRYTAIVGNGEITFPASNAEKRRVLYAHSAVKRASESVWGLAALSHEYGAEAATHVALRNLREYQAQDIARGEVQEMPISSRDLFAMGVEQGPAIGKMLKVAKDFWYSSNLRATRDNLLQVIRDEQKHVYGF